MKTYEKNILGQLAGAMVLAVGLMGAVPAAAAVTGKSSYAAESGYVWANQPNTASYTAPAAYAFNSAGGTNTIRRLGNGRYEVTFGRLKKLGGNVQVTAYGSGSNHCKVGSWSPVTAGMRVLVYCFDVHGAPVNSLYDVRYLN